MNNNEIIKLKKIISNQNQLIYYYRKEKAIKQYITKSRLKLKEELIKKERQDLINQKITRIEI
jgi:hypothetical protein